MAYLVKFQLSFVLILLRSGVQLNGVATESLGGDDVSNNITNNPKETTGLALIAPNRSPSDKEQRHIGKKHTCSPKKQTLGVISESHQSKIDAKLQQHSFICTPDQFACPDRLKCIPEKDLCNGVDNCEDRSDESESLCTPPCSSDMFACADGSKCIPKSYLCNGYFSHEHACADHSHTSPSRCDNCSADNLFLCPHLGLDVCLNVNLKCNGRYQCTDFSDNLLSECPNCLDDFRLFTCRAGGQMVCWTINYQCDGEYDCDDGSEEDPSVCDNCSQPGLAICRDGSRCFTTEWACDGDNDCIDGSDESDSYSRCEACTEEGFVPCPGFPGNCGKLCDGNVTCPDKWDELLSTCQSHLGGGQPNEAKDAATKLR